MIKVGIIGIGAISHAHIGSYLEFSDRCKITAICDITPEKMTDSQKKYNYTAIEYLNYEEMLDKEDLNLISICLPPFLHSEATIKSLLAGANVLCEKPMSPSLEECDKILEAQSKSKKKLSIISQNRFMTPIMRAKNMIENNKLGDLITYIRSDTKFWRGENYHHLWWRGTWDKEGGGNTLNHGIHAIDMFLWLMNKKIKEVSSLHANTYHTSAECEDISITLCSYEDGSIGEATSSIIQHDEGYTFEIQGLDASLEMPTIYEDETKIFSRVALPNGFGKVNVAKIEELTQYWNALPSIKYTGHKGQVDDVLQAIENDREPLITGIDGRNAIELITASYEAYHMKKTMTLPLTKNNSIFYTKDGILKNVKKFYEKTTDIQNFPTDDKFELPLP